MKTSRRVHLRQLFFAIILIVLFWTLVPVVMIQKHEGKFPVRLQMPVVSAEDRFPRPEFESGYERPARVTPAPRPAWRDYLDIGVLAAALGLAAWFSMTSRSRKGLFLIACFGAAYFGVVRGGCVCPVGSIQNVVYALANDAALPVYVVSFFLLPILSALLWGRVFCSGVCPLGALQEIVLIKPLRVWPLVDRVLRFLPWVVLAVVMITASAGRFLLCAIDPFVNIYRLSGDMTILIAGGIVLLISTMIARPYCRYVCPYGAVLGACARLAKTNLAITPDHCVRCGMCVNACPVGAIDSPVSGEFTPQELKRERIILVLLILLLPVVAVALSSVGRSLSTRVTNKNPDVILARLLNEEDPEAVKRYRWDETALLDGFRQSGMTVEEANARAQRVIHNGLLMGNIAGGGLGIIAMLGLIGLTLRRGRKDYLANPSRCIRCGRCWQACPRQAFVDQQKMGSALPETEKPLEM